MIEPASRDTFDLSVYLVTDTAMCAARGVPDTVRQAVAGGVTVVQLRDHEPSDDDFVSLGREVLAALRGSGVPLLINDRVHLVAAIGAQGAHIGQRDMPLTQARSMLGPGAILGLSISSGQEYAALLADPAARAGALDYLGIGPVRTTPTKPNAAPALGWHRLHDLVADAAVSTWPCVAIGGLDASDAPAMRAAGVDGMAVVSAICAAPDPATAARRLAEAWALSHRIPNALTIAGSDPSGGAGIQADLKTFSALGAFGMSALAALTAQNTQGVTGIHAVPLDFVRRQLDTLIADVRIDTVKIGMLATAELASVVGEYLSDTGPLATTPIVLDPVMVATSGDRLLDDDAVEAIRALLPLVDVVTPNVAELAVLTGLEPARDLDELADQAAQLRARIGSTEVYAKGGHLGGSAHADDLLIGASTTRLRADWVDTRNTHGTGCSLSSALAALRPQRLDWVEAAVDAKAWLARAIGAADTLRVGGIHADQSGQSGHGPVHHFVDLWGCG